MRTADTFCGEAWDAVSDGRVCRRCGWFVSGKELREKGTVPALEEKARACKLAAAIRNIEKQGVV